MSQEIKVIVEFDIAEGRAAEMKDICRAAVDLARAKDSGTLSFDLHFSADDRVMISLETYRDSQALLTHFGNAHNNVQKVKEIATITRLRVFGDVSDEIKTSFEAYNPIYLQHFCGL